MVDEFGIEVAQLIMFVGKLKVLIYIYNLNSIYFHTFIHRIDRVIRCLKGHNISVMEMSMLLLRGHFLAHDLFEEVQGL